MSVVLDVGTDNESLLRDDLYVVRTALTFVYRSLKPGFRDGPITE